MDEESECVGTRESKPWNTETSNDPIPHRRPVEEAWRCGRVEPHAWRPIGDLEERVELCSHPLLGAVRFRGQILGHKYVHAWPNFGPHVHAGPNVALGP